MTKKENITKEEKIEPQKEKIKEAEEIIKKDLEVFDISNTQKIDSEPKKTVKKTVKAPKKETKSKKIVSKVTKKETKKETKPLELIPQEKTKKQIWKNPYFWAGVLAASTGVMFMVWKLQEMRKNRRVELPQEPIDARVGSSEDFLNE